MIPHNWLVQLQKISAQLNSQLSCLISTNNSLHTPSISTNLIATWYFEIDQ